MCGSVYLYILGTCHYALNTFSALPNLPNRWILVNTVRESQFLQLLVNLCENARECSQIFGIRLFLENWCYVQFRLYTNKEFFKFLFRKCCRDPRTWPYKKHRNAWSTYHTQLVMSSTDSSWTTEHCGGRRTSARSQCQCTDVSYQNIWDNLCILGRIKLTKDVFFQFFWT